MNTSLTWLGRLATTPSGRDWRLLVDVYGPLLREWLTRAGVPHHDQDDVVQEVMVVVVRKVGEFEHRGPGAFRSWLRSILSNHTKKFFRDRLLTPSVNLDEIADSQSTLAQQWDREHDEHLTARVMKAIQPEFTPTTWAAFYRQVVDSQKPADVAKELGMTTNAVVIAKSRVLRRLRAELATLVES